MSDLNEEQLRTVCRLCRLKLTDDEIESFLADVKKIADYTELLGEVDLSDLQPYMHAEEVGFGQLREDEVKEPLKREEFLENAPDQVGGMIRVPPVIKQ
ncbi:MAG: Glutamyl-tRNA(Gln) amidotransferase subunit C [Chlamydiales bacterium]|nr:Glutamyl-tRNA(Gln) amidotransferase subunit C [Chlamydiales bacterium]MCH9635796.1 Glutamyl-tRNA(Gln) amidotransferase subunit C [Chlamydiales bacterium]MCH9704360.1 Asp-tRNA(Asn)/Glu-tRNA(Gln) amidotransferase subunit GatC [Chlamydiota bacterium]